MYAGVADNSGISESYVSLTAQDLLFLGSQYRAGTTISPNAVPNVIYMSATNGLGLGQAGGNTNFYFNTSTFATTLPGALAVDTSTLVVDATNNRVGINDATPSYDLDVTGDIYVTGRIGIGVAPIYPLAITYAGGNAPAIIVTHSGATGTNYGIQTSVTGAATTNYGGYFAASGAGTNVSVYGTGDISGGNIINRSSRRYKTNVRAAGAHPVILDVQPKMFDVVKDAGNEAATNLYGVIAEELDDLGLTELVAYDAEGRPDGVYYDKIGIVLIPIVKAQQAQIDALTARLTALENAQ
jgi:hypothetical protein